MSEISIVVPIYNTEAYLRKCVDSILAQTFTDFELILVDDGSTDGSGKICDEYLQKDSRVKVIHKKNGGLSAARNSGIEIAASPYIGFVDSDDFVDNDMYELLYRNAIEENADISVCGVYFYDVRGEKKIDKRMPKDTWVIDSSYDAAKWFLKKKIRGTIWDKIYKRELFDKVKFTDLAGEDIYFTGEVLLYIDKMVVVADPKYHYIYRESSLSRGGSTEVAEFKKNLSQNELICDKIERKYPQLSSLRNEYMYSIYFCTYTQIIFFRERNVTLENMIVNLIKESSKDILKDKEAGIRVKCGILVLMTSRRLYKLCISAAYSLRIMKKR